MEIRYQKRENEDKIEYAMRLIEILKTEHPEDLSWGDICELVDFNGHRDSLRKANDTFLGGYEIYHYCLNKFATENISDDKILKEYELKKIELQKEKVKLQTTKLEFNKLIRQNARYEEFWDRVAENIQTIDSPIFEEIDTFQNGKRIGLVGLSDIHFGKIFNSYNNSYSMDICKNRLNDLMNEIIEWVKDRGISELHILNCSDSIEGLLRISQIRVLEIGVIDSAIMFSRMMAEWLNNISKYIPITYHHVPSANHSEIRFLGVSAGQFPDEDLEKIIINYIHDVLQNNSRILVPIYENEYISFTINGKNIVAAHGQQFKGKKPETVLKELRLLLKQDIHLFIIGHLHHDSVVTVGEYEMGNIKTITLPSIMGSDSFSDSLLTGAKAGATFIEFNTNKKGITTTEVILN